MPDHGRWWAVISQTSVNGGRRIKWRPERRWYKLNMDTGYSQKLMLSALSTKWWQSNWLCYIIYTEINTRRSFNKLNFGILQHFFSFWKRVISCDIKISCQIGLNFGFILFHPIMNTSCKIIRKWNFYKPTFFHPKMHFVRPGSFRANVR